MNLPSRKAVISAVYYTGQAIGSLALLRLAFTPIGATMLLLYVVTQTAHEVWTANANLKKELNKEPTDV